MKLQIDTNMFYKIGFGCFAVTSICSIANMFIYWGSWNLPSKITNIAQFIFNLALVGLFYYLIKSQNLAQIKGSGGTSVEEVEMAFNEAESTLKHKTK